MYVPSPFPTWVYNNRRTTASYIHLNPRNPSQLACDDQNSFTATFSHISAWDPAPNLKHTQSQVWFSADGEKYRKLNEGMKGARDTGCTSMLTLVIPEGQNSGYFQHFLSNGRLSTLALEQEHIAWVNMNLFQNIRAQIFWLIWVTSAGMESSMKLPLLSCYSIYSERLGCESTIP